MIEGVKNDIEREKRYQERITRALNLSGGEQGTIHQMYASMQASRQRILDEMQSGVKTSEQADDEIDQLEDQTETAVRTLLGDERLKQAREARKAERMQARQQRDAQRGRPVSPTPAQ
jgi:ABC-type branched-subunit amino acid transport system ATPase component